MRRVLWIAAGIVTLGYAWRRHCRDGKGHRTRRHILGGQVCAECGRPFGDLAEAGLMDGGAYVPIVRRGMAGNGLERSER